MDPKAADANPNISMTQAYLRYLCTVVPFGFFSYTPLKRTAGNLDMHAMESAPPLYLECLTAHVFHMFPHELSDLVGFRGAIRKRYFCDVASLLFKLNTLN